MEVCILGPVGASRAGHEIVLGGSKPRTVLAALLLARGRLVPDGQLSELLWGWHPPTTVSAQIYTYVSRLRKRLAPEINIVRQPPGYLLRVESAEFDYDEFERSTLLGHGLIATGKYEGAARLFRAALDLWVGPTLANVTEFLSSAELPRLEEARMATLESRIDADLGLGGHQQLVPELTGLVAEYPMREQLRVQLMTALYRCERQADALAVFHEGRRVLVEELGVDPGAALANAHQAILRGELAFAPESGPGPTPEPRTWHQPKPAMLPPEVADFTGRVRHIAEVQRMLRSRGNDGGWRPAQFLITGMAGVGKSALALRIAHACRDEFADGQLYVDLGGASQRTQDPFDVLGWFLRALGTAESAVPASSVERQQLYRSQMAGRRMLVVLDNASDGAQARALLPGGQECRVIVTSRARLAAMEGAHVTELDVMDADEALLLLERMVPAERVRSETEAAARLITLCDRLPLALRAAGARLAVKRRMPLGRLVFLLADDRRRLDELQVGGLDIRASLYASYDALDCRARTAFRCLALLDMPGIPAWAVHQVLGTSRQAAEKQMEALVGAGLLEASGTEENEGGGMRYRFLSLVSLFARERADKEDTAEQRAATLDRAIVAWLEAARYTDWPPADAPLLALTPAPYGGRPTDDPLDWFDAEEEALVTLYHQACGSGRHREAWELSAAWGDLFGMAASGPSLPAPA